jgi:hypothetical protein
MTLTYTRDDVVRYIFNETSPEEAAAISGQLLIDPDLQDFYSCCNELVRDICRLNLSPTKKTIDKILSYSRSYSLQAAR